MSVREFFKLMKSEPTMLFDERVVILFRLELMTEGTEVSDFVLNNDLLVFVYLSVSMSAEEIKS